jgi:putative membrane protein
MRIIAVLLVAVVALSHLGFLVLEMFYWNHPIGRQIFETTPDFLCCVIAAGVYGGLTAKMSILYVQGAPALAALIAVLAARPPRTRHYRL